jgi:hypothetical protein
LSKPDPNVTDPDRPVRPRQPAPLEAPAARRDATRDEIESLRRFHLGMLGMQKGGEGEGTVSLWSWLLQAEPAAPPVSGPPVAGVAVATPPRDVAVPLSLLWTRLAERAGPARAEWLDESHRLHRALRTLLERHPAPAAEQAAERLRHGLGDVGSRFVDPAALASRLGAGGQPLSSQRRERIEVALERLERIEGAGAATALCGVLVCDSSLAHHFGIDAVVETLQGVGATARVEIADEPCEHLAQVFDRQASALADAVAAVRVARLELEDAFDPALHDTALATFDWQAFHRQELAILPPMVAVLSADTMSGASLGPLFRLLLSGRPVQVVVLVDPASSPGAGIGMASSAYRFEPGLLALGLRRALVHQGSLACLEELERSTARAATATHGSLFVLAASSLSAPAGPGRSAGDAEAIALLALASRAHPVFECEPAGDGADAPARPRLGASQGTGHGWSHTLGLVAGNGPGVSGAPGDTEQTTHCTFADYALASGCFTGDFLPVDDEVRHDVLVPMADWLALAEAETHQLLPFVWAVVPEAGDGVPVARLRRMVATRRLALCARDRLDTWRTLIGLAGQQQRDREDAASPRIESPAQAFADSSAQAPSAALDEQRRVVAQEIVNRLVAALIGEPASAGSAPERAADA